MTKKNQPVKRLFFALKIPNLMLSQTSLWLDKSVQSERPPVRKENLHLTLAFLGQVNDAQQQKYCHLASTILCQPFTLTFRQTGYWQNSGIFYLKPEENSKLNDLANNLRKTSEQLATFSNAFSFHPHITLIRNVKKKCPKIRQPCPSFTVQFTEFHLFHSTQIRQQLSYVPIKSFSLL